MNNIETIERKNILVNETYLKKWNTNIDNIYIYFVKYGFKLPAHILYKQRKENNEWYNQLSIIIEFENPTEKNGIKYYYSKGTKKYIIDKI